MTICGLGIAFGFAVAAGSNPVSVFDQSGTPTEWAGYDLDEGGNADTGEWIGNVNAMDAPWIHVSLLNTHIYVDEAMIAEDGWWAYFPYKNSPPDVWSTHDNGVANTGNFMRQIYDSGHDWVYSYSLSRWIFLPPAGADALGNWGFIPTELDPPTVDYLIPAIWETPLIDGIISEGEWDEANMYEHSYASLILTGIGTSTLDNAAGEPQPDAPRASADVYIGATLQGLYMAFDVTDDELTINNEFGAAGNNSDGVQVGVDVNPDPQNRDSTVLFDINPTSLVNGEPTGPVNVFARWAANGYDVTWGIQAASSIHEGGYSIEIMIPWALLTSFGVDHPLEEGSTMRLTVALLAQSAGFDGESSDILWDSGAGTMGVGNAANWPFAIIEEELFRTPIKYSIPRVSAAPTIDGTIDPNEWRFATYTEASYDNWVARAGGTSRIDVFSGGMPNPDAPRSEGGIYLMATDEALYMAAEIVAPNITIRTPFGSASNGESGVQMALGLDPTSTRRDDNFVLWDFTAATVEGDELIGPANIFGRWGISPGFNAGWGIESAGSFTDDGYIIEVKLPWQVMRESVNVNVDNPLEKGDIFNLGFVIVDIAEDNSLNELLVDFGRGGISIGEPATWNIAVMRD